MSATEQKVIKLVARPVRREVYKNGENEVNLGDRSVFTHEISLDGEPVGFDGGVCTVVRLDGGHSYIVCNVSMNLPDGIIAFQTFVEEVFPPPPFFAAVTGGTGAYRGARGEMHIDPASPETHFYTLYLDDSEGQRT
ncbi:MAG: allene oxide cyclase barrel-like domain-containing protein [Streptosporangiaceae bacterium]